MHFPTPETFMNKMGEAVPLITVFTLPFGAIYWLGYTVCKRVGEIIHKRKDSGK